MWVDETVGAGGPEPTDTPDQLDITVAGEEYQAPTNYDFNHDGLTDTARIEHEDHSVTGYTDVDHDGDADTYVHVNADGTVVESARFDEATGQWIAAPADSAASALATNDGSTGLAGNEPVAMDAGGFDAGPATIDTNADGINDTAIVQDEEGNTRFFTDANGDGVADMQTVLDSHGNATNYDRAPDGSWVVAPTPPDSPAEGSDQVWGNANPSQGDVTHSDKPAENWTNL